MPTRPARKGAAPPTWLREDTAWLLARLMTKDREIDPAWLTEESPDIRQLALTLQNAPLEERRERLERWALDRGCGIEEIKKRLVAVDPDGPRPPRSRRKHSPSPTFLDDLFLRDLPSSAFPPHVREYVTLMGRCTEAPAALHLAAFLTCVGAILGKTVWKTSGQRLFPNLFVALLGTTGKTRKSTAARYALDLLTRRVEPNLKPLSGVGSAEAFVQHCAEAEMSTDQLDAYRKNALGDESVRMVRHRRVLLFEDEMATFLHKARRESSGAVIPKLTSAWDCPSTLESKTLRKHVIAHNPAVSFLACSTPYWLQRYSDISDVLGGFTNRFLFFEGPPGPPLPDPPSPPESELAPIIQHLREVRDHYATYPQELSFTEAARVAWEAAYLERYHLNPSSEVIGALTMRIDANALKVALIYAALEKASVIDVHHLDAGRAVALFSAGVMKEHLEGVADTRSGKLELKVERLLKSEPRSLNELRQNIRDSDLDALQKVVATLLAARLIAPVEGSRTIRYHWLGDDPQA